MSPLGSALLPAVCGLCLAAQYLFMINYAAPRFLLPAYALLAIPAADGLAFLVTRTGMNLRPAMTAVVTCFLVAQLVAQHLVVDHEAGGTVAFHDDYAPSICAIPAEHPADDNGVEVPRSVCGRLFPGIAYEPGRYCWVTLRTLEQIHPPITCHSRGCPARAVRALPATAFLSPCSHLAVCGGW